jgi:uncharacterized small protein (DUF1192 family)
LLRRFRASLAFLFRKKSSVMDLDDLRPRTPPTTGIIVGENLERLSVADLTARIAALEGEIARVKTEMTKRQAQSSAADALFKKK